MAAKAAETPASSDVFKGSPASRSVDTAAPAPRATATNGRIAEGSFEATQELSHPCFASAIRRLIERAATMVHWWAARAERSEEMSMAGMVALEPGFHKVGGNAGTMPIEFPPGLFDAEAGPVDDVVAGRRRWAVLGGDALGILGDVAPGTFDAVVADPPYSSGGAFRVDKARDTAGKYQQGSARARYPDFSGDSRDQRSLLAWSTLWLAAAHRATRPSGIAMIFSDWRQLPTTTDALQAGGWVWRGVVPWDKRRARPSMGSFTNQCEYVVWGSSGPVDRKAAPLPGFYSIHVDPREKLHMAGKPVALMRGLLRILPADSLVLDPFCGSGSTGVAAILEGLRFVGIELDEHYVDAASKRLDATPLREIQMKAIRFTRTDGGASEILRCTLDAPEFLERVRDLFGEATAAGDEAQVDICSAALAGSVTARLECARVMREAEAQKA